MLQKKHSKRERNGNWFDDDCKEMIEKNKARKIMLARNTRSNKETYCKLRKDAKKMTKKKKRESLNKEIQDIEDLNKEGEDRKFYAAMKKIRKEFQPKVAGCRNESGVIITDVKKTMVRWALHFKELLNKHDTADEITTNVQTAPDNITEGEEVPTLSEVQKAIQRLRNNRAPGEDDIVAELIKYGGNQFEEAIREIINDIWTQEKMPDC